MKTGKPHAVEYDLHGIVGIRLLDARPSDCAAVARQLGPIAATLDREPDIIIRFVEELRHSGAVRYLGLDDSGFTDDEFLVFRGRHKTRVGVQIPFEDIGNRQIEIVCESGLASVPLLIAIINLIALGKDVIPLHASAFIYQGSGILTTGWSKGGKTEALLGFLADGAEYVGDEWVYLARDGERMVGIPEPVRVWDWHLQHLPRYRATLTATERLKLGIAKLLGQSMEWIASGALPDKLPGVGTIRRLIPFVKNQRGVDIPPERLVGRTLGSMSASVDKLFLVASRQGPEVAVHRTDPLEIARRMVFSLEEERSLLMSYYRKFRFAFPERRNEFIEDTERIQREMLCEAMAQKDAYTIYHPYPVVIPDMLEAMRPLCATTVGEKEAKTVGEKEAESVGEKEAEGVAEKEPEVKCSP